MESKVIRGGKVAVLYSPGWGAGWSTWNADIESFLMFDPTLVEYVENDERDRIPAYVQSVFPDAYTGGAEDLSIMWITQGLQFRITEYDGSESVEVRENIPWELA